MVPGIKVVFKGTAPGRKIYTVLVTVVKNFNWFRLVYGFNKFFWFGKVDLLGKPPLIVFPVYKAE